MLELHSNFTIQGSKGITNGVLGTGKTPGRHESPSRSRKASTRGSSWDFTSSPPRNPEQGWQWVGDHICPARCGCRRIGTGRWASAYRWKSAISDISFRPDTWIPWNCAAYCRQDHRALVYGVQPGAGPDFPRAGCESGLWCFSPNVKVTGYDITKKINAGFEYYGVLGSPLPASRRSRNRGRTSSP